MDETIFSYPGNYNPIAEETSKLDFDQTSDPKLGTLLASLAACKPGGSLLELGTGTGLSTSWLLHGMDSTSTLISIDNNNALVEVATKYTKDDKRVSFIVGDGEELIKSTAPGSIDLIFADTWPGKYFHLEETLQLLKPGGIYLIDDMLPQDNWPDGHNIKATTLITELESRNDLVITKMNWSTGIILCTKH